MDVLLRDVPVSGRHFRPRARCGDKSYYQMMWGPKGLLTTIIAEKTRLANQRRSGVM